jgi:hypothetical protein
VSTWLDVQTLLVHAPYHTHDGRPCGPTLSNSTSGRILAKEEACGEYLVDHRNDLAVQLISVLEGTTT